MWFPLADFLPWLWYALLLASIVAGLLLNILGVPGLWLIVIAAIAYGWGFGLQLIGWWTIGAVVALALGAELVEFLAGAAGSRAAGGSKRGMAGAMVGGLAGGIAGTPIFPIVGTIVGSVLGTFAGAYVVEWLIGRAHGESFAISYGAAKGRIVGMVAKSLFGVLMGATVAVMGLPLPSRLRPTPAPAMLPPTSHPATITTARSSA